jgi:arabinogalactan oligomer/maltooligosaccharide transport system substrate-binding protein
MPKFRLLIVSVLLIASMLLAACQATPAAQPTTAPTTAPEPTKPTVTCDVKGEVTLWHSYHTGGSEEASINQLVDKLKTDCPDAKVNVLAIPFDQIFNKWETEVAAGGGPDMFVAPNDNLGKESRANLLLALDDKLAGKLDKVSPTGVEGMKVDGKLYGVPQLFKAVALYYNKSKVATPPATTDELLQMVKDKKATIVLNQNAYHNFGFWPAFGPVLAADGTCTPNTGLDKAFQYLVDLKAAGALFETDGGKADTMFRQGQVDMIINGPWVLGDYKGDLKDNLGVAPIPAGPAGPAQPLTGVDGFFINPNSKNADGAVALALYLTSADGQGVYANVAGDVPVRTDVDIKDPLVKAFAAASAAGFPRPQSAWFDNYWGPFGDQLTKVLEGQATAADGATAACADMNKANGK